MEYYYGLTISVSVEELFHGVNPRANGLGVLSFDLEALDRWYGVKEKV